MPTLRQADADDAEELGQVRHDAWQWAYRGQVPAQHLAVLSPLRERLDWLEWFSTTRPTNITKEAWVAVHAGRIVGFTTHRVLRDPIVIGELTEIYVRPDVVRAGVGRALMNNAVDRMAQAGATDLVVRVLESNHRAHRFYEALGWSRVRHFKKPFGLVAGDVTVVQYERTLHSGSTSP
jgi:GNAT superfamily N-acetyltransferase